MALANRLDAARATPALQRWLADQLDDASDVAVTDVVVPAASGLSCETVLFSATWTHAGPAGAPGRGAFVARVAPADGSGLFPSYHLDVEARVMRALAEHTPVPAPRVVGIELDADALGGRFLVMERIGGRVPPDDPPYSLAGWVLDLTPVEQRTLIENAVATIAAVAAVDPAALNLPLARVGLPQQLAHLDHLYESGHRGLAHPTVEAGLTYLHANMPTGEPSGLCWGDARIGNMLFADDLSVAGALDWELASIGSPDLDLAYFLYALRLWSDGYGAPAPAGFPHREEIVHRFAELSGHPPRHLEYYERYAATFGAIAVLRAGHLMTDAGILPPGSPMWLSNPASVMLAEYLGVDQPAGAVTGWAGHR